MTVANRLVSKFHLARHVSHISPALTVSRWSPHFLVGFCSNWKWIFSIISMPFGWLHTVKSTCHSRLCGKKEMLQSNVQKWLKPMSMNSKLWETHRTKLWVLIKTKCTGSSWGIKKQSKTQVSVIFFSLLILKWHWKFSLFSIWLEWHWSHFLTCLVLKALDMTCSDDAT